MMELPVIIAVLFEHTVKEFQFWEMFMVADDCSFMYQGR
jgi:hypothetical protein